MRLPTVLVNRPLRKAADTGLVDMDWKRPSDWGGGRPVKGTDAMIPSLERGCQLRWYRPCGDEFPIWSGVEIPWRLWRP